MSTLWTPGGEVPIRKEPPAPAGAPGAAPPGATPPGAAPPGAPAGELSEEQAAAQLADLQERLAQTPAEVIVANHAFGLFELAALHLSLQPPQLDQARLAIDAFAALVEGLGDRLGDASHQLSDSLSQLRMAFVEIHGAQRPPAGDGGT
ncbi:MAG: hypothetical protein ACRDYY_12160 [Acidimicrobiales bacterium]